jgi:predicted transcriptional regulator
MNAPEYAAIGLIVAKLLLEIMRVASCRLFKQPRYTSASDEVLIYAAIFLGHAEGRPMTAGKLADFIGMPRATVDRKVKLLAEKGFVSADHNKRWMVKTKGKDLPDGMDKMVEDAIKLIRKAHAELSKMGN